MKPWLLAAALAATAAAAPVPDDLAARAARLHRQSIVVDTHEDVPDALTEKWADVGVRGSTKHFDIPLAKEGGLTAPFFAVYVSASYADAGAARVALASIDLVQRVVAAHPADLGGVLAGLLGDEREEDRDPHGHRGRHAIEDRWGPCGLLPPGRPLHDAHPYHTNHWADSSGNFFAPASIPSPTVHHGLNDFGRGW
jgi:hypothetical protein